LGLAPAAELVEVTSIQEQAALAIRPVRIADPKYSKEARKAKISRHCCAASGYYSRRSRQLKFRS